MSSVSVRGLRRRRFAQITVVIAAVAAIVLAYGQAVKTTSYPIGDSSDPRVSSDTPTSSDFLLGSYANAVYLPGVVRGLRRIDSAATIMRLRTLNANAYAYLISPQSTKNSSVSQGQWNDLAGFAQAAGAAKIRVYVYLVPPTEAGELLYYPFHWDYKLWAEQIALTAVSHPAIRGIIIDDFASNVASANTLGFHFTPAYVADMLARARLKASWMTFYPVLYYHDMVGGDAIVAQYRNVISGLIFPYLGEQADRRTPGNTVDAEGALSQGRRVGGLVKCGTNMPCTQIYFSAAGGVGPLEYASYEATLVPDDARKGARLVFWSNDDRAVGDLQTYSVDVRLNGQLVGDVRVDSPGWMRHEVDLAGALRDHSLNFLSITVERDGPLPEKALTVLLRDFEVEGFTHSVTLSAEHMTTSGGVMATEAGDLGVIFMTYAAPLGGEAHIGASPDYVSSVLSSLAQLRREAMVDGSLVYALNLTGSPGEVGHKGSFEVVRSRYLQWATTR